MKNNLREFKVQLLNADIEEKLGVLLDMIKFMANHNLSGAESYIEEGIDLAKSREEYEILAQFYEYQIWFHRQAQKLDLAREGYQKILELKDKLINKAKYVFALRGMGISYGRDSEKRMFWFEKAYKASIKYGVKSEEVSAHLCFGGIYEQRMLYDKSMTHYLKALDLAKEMNNRELISISYYSLSSIVEAERGIEYLEKAIEIHQKYPQKNSNHYLQNFYTNLSDKCQKVKQFEKSILAIDAAIEIAERINAPEPLSKVYITKMTALIVQYKEGADQTNTLLLEEANKVCLKAFKVVNQNDLNLAYFQICLKQAEIDYYLGNYKKTLQELLKVEAFLLQNKHIDEFKTHLVCNDLLWKTYEALSDVKKAFQYYKKFIEWNNKAKHTESVKHAQKIEAQFAAKEKEVEVKRLQEMEEMKTRFFSQITHELRTPLSLILGPARQIPKTEKRGEVNQQASVIERNAARLLQLVNQLLDVNKLEAGKMQLKKSHGDFPLFVETVLNAFQTIATQKQIQLDFICQIDELIANFDSDKIEKILYNLVSNAFKFTPMGGQIICQLLLQDGKEEGIYNIELILSDTGKGISEENLPFIFDRFYQADNSYTREAEGTGIGLSLVKELIDLMEGEIEVKSTLGKGTIFRMELPLEVGETEQVVDSVYEVSEQFYELREANASIQQGAKSVSKQNVPVLLLIEDNPDMHTYIRGILEKDYIILDAMDGQQGTDLALERIPDIIISDVMMPQKDGYQVCAKLKEEERTSHIPIILLTAKAALKSRLEGLEQGADAYLSKPFNAEELKLQVKNLLATQASLQSKYGNLEFAKKGAKTLTKEEQFLKKVKEYIEEHIEEEELNVEILSQVLLMSPSQLYRKIHALTKLSPSEFIRSIRLLKGKLLLESQQFNVSEVAYQVGLKPRYFSRVFKKKYGCLPKTLLK